MDIEQKLEYLCDIAEELYARGMRNDCVVPVIQNWSLKELCESGKRVLDELEIALGEEYYE